MYKIFLWGMGNDYDLILNQVFFERNKGNISVVGIICRPNDAYCSYKDGFRVFSKNEIFAIDYDYIVITSSQYYKEIVKEALEIGISKNVLIDGRVFRTAYFDFAKYASLRENPVTILSDDCWGGYVYNRLNLQFSSPLINIYWDRVEYAKFIEDPIFYLSTELKMVRDGNLRKGIHPLASLGDNGRTVQLELVHNSSFEEAKIQWDRRRKRINPNNLFIKMGFSSDINEKEKNFYLKSFDNVPYKKVLFYYGDEEIKGMFKTERFIFEELKKPRVEMFDYNGYLRNAYFWDLDPLNLLLYGENYSRCTLLENNKEMPK